MIKKYYGLKLTKRYIIFTLFSFLTLLVGTYTMIFHGDWYFIVLFILSVIINLLWIIIIHAIYKTRIEIGDKSIRGAFHIWYEGFKVTVNDKLIYDEIQYSKIKYLEVIEVLIEINHTTTKALKIEVHDSFVVVLLLDSLDHEQQAKVIEHVTKQVQLL